jgi:drug/metabolite transporter (DMT)-like permease
LKNQQKAYIYAMGAVLLWSTVATAFKIALGTMSSLSLLFWSSIVAFLCLCLIFFLGNQSHRKISLDFNSIVLAALRGLLNPFLYYLVLFKAYELLPAQEAMSLNYVWPMTLVLLSVPVLGQRIKYLGMLALVISFFGVLIIATQGRLSSLEFADPWGAALALGSSLIWASFWLLNLKSKEGNTWKLLLSFGFGTLYILPVLFFTEGIQFPSIKGFLAASYVGIAEMGLTFFLWLKALALSERTDRVSRLIYLSPFLSLFVIAIILDEKIGIYTLIGLVFIIGGILLSQLKRKPS